MGDSKELEAGNWHWEKEEGKRMLDQFPSNNPNPALRVDGEGSILYANKAAGPLVEYWGAGEGKKLSKLMADKIRGVLFQKKPEQLEINTEKKIYSLTLCPLPEANCVDLYGFDISPFRRAEEELKKKYEELEAKAGKRELELTGAKERFQGEISGKKQTGKALQDSPSFLKTLLNTIPAPILSKDREGKYRECNELFSREIAGLPKEEIIGKTIKEVFPKLSPELADAIHRQDLELLESGGKDSYEIEFPCVDGTIRNFLVNRAVFEDENGKTATMVAVMLDVSELRRNEKKIRNNVKFLETLLNSIPNPVFYKDRNGAYLGCNETFSRMITGLPEEEILGHTLPELADRFVIDFSPKFSTEEIRKLIENSDEYHREELELLKSGGSQLEEYEAFCTDGMKRDFLTSRTAYRNEEGQVAGMVSVMQDITRIKQVERMLRDNLHFLETLLNTIPNPVFYKDRNGTFIGCNEVFASQVLGLPREKIIGKPLPSLQVPVPEELKEYCHTVALELVRSGGNQAQDLRFVCADGKTRDFIVSRAAFRDEEGEIAGIVGVMQDITQRRRTEETLRNTVSFLEALLDDIPSPVFQRDKSGIYLNCNESFASQIMGLPKEKVIGGSFIEFQKRIPKELVDIYQLHDQELLKQGESQYYETKVVCADGVKRDFLFHKAPYKDSYGNVSGIAGVMLDITQRKAAEEIFRKGEERYRIVAEQTGQLVYDYDIESKQIDWAGAIKELTGYSPEEFRQVNLEGWRDHIHPEDRESAWEAHERCMRTGEKYLAEYRFRKKDGSYFHVEDSSVYLKNEKGQMNRIIGVIKDISERKVAREILEKSEERFRAVAERTGQLVYDYDLRTKQSSWEGAIEELTGYGHEEFQGFTPEVWAEHLHPEDRERTVKAHKKCLETGEDFHEEYRFRRKDGTYFYAEDNGFYLKDENGKVYRAPGVIKDITERKKTREILEKSEERFRAVAERTGQLVYDYDLRTKQSSWEGAIEELTGQSYEDFQRFTPEVWAEHLHPEDRQRAVEIYKKCLETGEDFYKEYRFRRKDGSYFYAEDNGFYSKDRDGKVYRTAGVIKDISERKLAKEKLEKSEEKYRQAAEQTGQIVFEHDIKNEVIDWTGAIQELTGYSAEEFQKFDTEKWEEHVHPEDRKKAVERITQALEKGGRFFEEYRFRRKDGDYFYVESSGVGMLDEEGKPFRALGVMKDITERKLAREKLEKSEERYRLAAEQTGQLVFDYDIATGKTDWAGAIKKLTGYSVEDFQKFREDEWISHIHPEERMQVVESIKKSLETGDRIQEEYRFRRKDGSYFYVEDSGTVLKDENGRPYRVIGVKKDVTEQKLAREKLEKSEERYRLIAEHTGQVLYHDNYTRGVIEWAGAIPEITGYGFEEFQEITENGWLGQIHPEDKERVMAAHERCRKTGGDFFEEYRLKRADGSYVTVEDEGVYLKDEKGTVCKALGVIKDIAEKKLAQKKLAESEERFRVAAEQTGQIVFEHDHINDILSWAGAITEITGYSIEEFQEFGGKIWARNIHPEDQERVFSELKKSREKDSHFRVEYRFSRKDGSYFHVEDSGVYLRNEEGQIRKAVGVIKDISPIKLAAEKLQESEERFRIAAEKTGQLVYDFDIGSEEIRWAGAIEDISGYTHEEIHKLATRKLWKERIHPEDYEKVVTYFANALKTGGSYCQEYRFKRKSGDYICVEDCGIYLRDKKDRVYRMIGVIKDITERKRGTEELRKSEERFRVVAEQTGQLVYDYDILADKIRWAGAVKELMDYSEEEFKNITSLEDWKRLMHPEDCKLAVDSYKKCLETGERYREEYRFKRKDGNYLYVENRGVFLKDGNGRIYRMLGANKDITQLKNSLEKVRESEEKYRSFIQNFKGIAFQGDMDFNALFMHGSLEEITGYREEDFVPGGLRWDRIIDPEDLPVIYEDAKELRTVPGAAIEREYRIRKKDGNVCWVHEIVQNISDESGKPILVQGSIYDVTERKEAEEALARTEEIRKKEIHHRIKNNLQVISSLLELQADQFGEEKVVEAFRESQNRVASMAIIHEELYRGGDTETLDFAAYLRKLTADLLRSYAVGKEDVKLKLEVEEIFLGMDTAIPLGIIVNELVSNALKHAFHPGKKGEIHVKLFRKESSGNKSISNITNNSDTRSNISKDNRFTLIVSDNGLGFPENIDFTNTDSLGLQLVNTLVEQLEGTIELKRNGTTVFRIKFLENSQ